MSDSIKGSLYGSGCTQKMCLMFKKGRGSVFCSDEESAGFGVSHIQVFTTGA